MYHMSSRYTCFHSMYCHREQSVYGLCGWIDLQYHDQRSHLYNLYNMSSRNAGIHSMYYYGKQRLHRVCSWIDIQ